MSPARATLLLPFRATRYFWLEYLPERFGPPKNVGVGFRLYDRPLLATYSRSGTNWVRYIIEFISGEPTPGARRIHASDAGEFIIDRAHKAFPSMQRYPRVLLVLRDYKECLLRHHATFWSETQDVTTFLESTTVDQPPEWYVKNIQAFERFSGAKLLIYYEDLLQSPETEIPKLATFLSLDAGRTERFLGGLDERVTESVNAYVSGGHGSESLKHKNNLTYHSRTNLTPSQLEEFDAFYERRHPVLFEKYLKRYKSVDSDA